MNHKLWALAALAFAALANGQDQKLRVIVFGAHPDDAEFAAGGTAAKFAKAGHQVKLVSVTNGDAGHCSQGGGALAKRRYSESQEVARRLGIAAYEVLDNHDGELVPSLEVRKQIIRVIRLWKADIVIAHRPNDYHPDHRYTGVLVQDAAFMVLIPFIVPDVEPLKRNPVFLSSQDRFQKPLPFRPDIAIDIDDVWKTKVDALDAIESQVYEAQPYCWGGMTSGVPEGKAERRQWLEKRVSRPMAPAVREKLAHYYGADGAKRIQHAEAFEICEYGRQPSADEIRQLFPFLPK